MPYLLLLAYLVPRTASLVTSKKSSSAFSALGFTGSLLYTLEISVLSLFVYWMANGFTLSLNGTVLIYGAAYGFFAFFCLLITVFMYNYGSITLVNFVSSIVSLISSSVFGALLLGEKITPTLILRVALMLLCVFIVYLGAKKGEETNRVAEQKAAEKRKKKLSPLSIILPSLYALSGLAATFLVKYYTADPTATDTNSLFFTVNLFSLVYTLPLLYFASKKQKLGFKQVALACVNKRSLIVVLNSVVGGVQTIITALLIERMDVALYTPVTSAIGYIALAVATPIVREKLDRYTVIATVAAVLSIFLPILIFP